MYDMRLLAIRNFGVLDNMEQLCIRLRGKSTPFGGKFAQKKRPRRRGLASLNTTDYWIYRADFLGNGRCACRAAASSSGTSGASESLGSLSPAPFSSARILRCISSSANCCLRCMSCGSSKFNNKGGSPSKTVVAMPAMRQPSGSFRNIHTMSSVWGWPSSPRSVHFDATWAPCSSPSLSNSTSPTSNVADSLPGGATTMFILAVSSKASLVSMEFALSSSPFLTASRNTATASAGPAPSPSAASVCDASFAAAESPAAPSVAAELLQPATVPKNNAAQTAQPHVRIGAPPDLMVPSLRGGAGR